MPAKKLDITIEQGAEFVMNLTWKNPAGSPVNLTGYTAKMQARLKYSDITPLVTFSTSDGTIVLGGALGIGATPSYGTSGQALLSGGNAASPTWSDVVTPTGTQTLTNKRVTARVSSTTSITSPLAWNGDNFDQYAATAQAAALTLNADAGTPTDGQKITFRIKDNATPRVLTFTGGASKGFRPIGVMMTASGSNWTYTTTASKTVYFGCVYNAADQRWDIVAISQEA
jgi:hypothetical protein